jgi:hypothetical protein
MKKSEPKKQAKPADKETLRKPGTHESHAYDWRKGNLNQCK